MSDINKDNQEVSVSDFLEKEVDKMIKEYKDIPEENRIIVDRDFDGKDFYEYINEKPDTRIEIVFDDEIESLNEFVQAISDFMDDQLDTPYPDDKSGPTLIWNPEYKILAGYLVVIPSWDIALNYQDEMDIREKRSENIYVG